MKPVKRNMLILAGAGAVAALLLAGAASPLAGERGDDVVTRAEVRVVVANGDDDAVREVYVVRNGEGCCSGAFLGVSVEEEVERSDGGARVNHVVEGSAADEAGLREGDVLVEINGQSIYGPRALTKAIQALEPGDTANIEIIRDDKRQSLSVELGERAGQWNYRFKGDCDGGECEHTFEWNHEQFQEQMEELHEKLGNRNFSMPRLHFGEGNFEFFGRRPKLGVELIAATPELREHLGGSPDAGVLVGKVIEGTPAEEFGIRVGDLIESVDGETIEDAGDLIHALQDAEGRRISIGVIRDGRAERVNVSIPEPEPSRLRQDGPKA